MLFENMVLDLKLWENGDLGMKRYVKSANHLGFS